MHRNSNQNDGPHHLYEIWDEQEEEVFKYGISSEPIEQDGQSFLLGLVAWRNSPMFFFVASHIIVLYLFGRYASRNA